MWMFDWFFTYFNNLYSQFNSISSTIEGVPAIGPYLAYPFYVISIWFYNLATASQYLSKSYDSVISDIDAIKNSINTIFNVAFENVWAGISDLQNRVAILEQQGIAGIQAYIDQFNTKMGDIVDFVNTYLVNRMNDLGNIYNDLESKVYNEVIPMINTIGRDLSTLQADFNALKDLITNAGSGGLGDILDIGNLIGQIFKFVTDHWSDLETPVIWFIDKCLELVATQAAHFTNGIVSVVEAVLSSIELPEK